MNDVTSGDNDDDDYSIGSCDDGGGGSLSDICMTKCFQNECDKIQFFLLLF